MSKIPKKSVEEWLKEVDYSFKGYVPTEESLMFINFIKEVNDGVEENESPIIHLKMADNVFSPTKRNAILAARGLSKTSLFGEYLTLWIASFGHIPNFGRVPLSLYITDSIENGVKNLRRNVEFRYQNSDYLSYLIPKKRLTLGADNGRRVEFEHYEEALYGGYKFTDIRIEFENRKGDRYVVKGYGVKTGVRGPLALNELVYTDNGTKTIKDVSVGDYVFTPYGVSSKVVGKSDIFHDDMYELIFADGRKIKVDKSHRHPLLKWFDTSINGKRFRDYKKIEITTEELLKEELKKGTNSIFLTEIPEPPKFSRKSFLLDEYLIGISLGDGNIPYSKDLRINGLQEDIEYYSEEIKKYNFTKTDYVNKYNTEMSKISVHNITNELKKIGIAGVIGSDKFIPKEYMFGSIEQRKRLLSGLLDTDGSCSKDGRVSFTNISKQLADDVAELARSLGCYVSYSNRESTGNKKHLYRLYIRSPYNPFLLPRKAKLWKKAKRFKGRVPLVAINKIQNEPSQCIRIEHESHEFITTGMLSTYNTKEMGIRPYLATFDDLLGGDDDARSPVVIQSVKNTIYKDVAKALHPTKQKMIYVGTPYNQNDPLYQAIGSGVWNVNVYPICEHFDSKTTKDIFRGAWEDRFPFEYVKEAFDEAVGVGEPQAFFQELMLRVTNEEDRLVKDDDIQWYKFREDIFEHKENYNFYITTDLATSTKDSSDYSVISVWAYDKDKKWYWVDGVVERQTVDKSMDDIFRFNKMYEPYFVSIERQGSQKGFISLFKREMNNRNEYFAIASDKNSGEEGFTAYRDKVQRFMLVLPLFKSKKIYFPRDLETDPRIVEAMNELRSISTSGISSLHDDFLDTISHLPLLKVFEPTKEFKEKEKEKKNRDADLNDPFNALFKDSEINSTNSKVMSSYVV
jgi:predicted phage terminase large subunit-like protein